MYDIRRTIQALIIFWLPFSPRITLVRSIWKRWVSSPSRRWHNHWVADPKDMVLTWWEEVGPNGILEAPRVTPPPPRPLPHAWFREHDRSPSGLLPWKAGALTYYFLQSIPGLVPMGHGGPSDWRTDANSSKTEPPSSMYHPSHEAHLGSISPFGHPFHMQC